MYYSIFLEEIKFAMASILFVLLLKVILTTEKKNSLSGRKMREECENKHKYLIL